MNEEYMQESAPQEQRPQTAQPIRRRRKKKSKWQIFKERYIPLAVLLCGVVLVIFAIIGLVKLVSNGFQEETVPTNPVITEPTDPPAQAETVLEPAKALAANYDYDAAIDVLLSYNGIDNRVELLLKEYRAARDSLIVWDDNTRIPHISFQNLIADTSLAFDGDTAAAGYKRNHLTVTEFQNILKQLYDNGFVLVSSSQVAQPDAGGIYTAQEIKLPPAKKPIMLSMLPAGYAPDRANNGFARRLTVSPEGKLTAEYLDSTATTLSGAYDFVSVLEEFLAMNPDFSYRGARAILGFNGDELPLGYDPANPQDLEELTNVLSCLKETGYEFACFGYTGLRYGDSKAEDIQADLEQWTNTYGSLLGDVKILIYAGGSDLLKYEGDQYDAVYGAGFRFFVGMDNSAESWGSIEPGYVRQTRRTVNGTRITENPELLDDLFVAKKVIDPKR